MEVGDCREREGSWAFRRRDRDRLADQLHALLLLCGKPCEQNKHGASGWEERCPASQGGEGGGGQELLPKPETWSPAFPARKAVAPENAGGKESSTETKPGTPLRTTAPIELRSPR